MIIDLTIAANFTDALTRLRCLEMRLALWGVDLAECGLGHA